MIDKDGNAISCIVKTYTISVDNIIIVKLDTVIEDAKVNILTENYDSDVLINNESVDNPPENCSVDDGETLTVFLIIVPMIIVMPGKKRMMMQPIIMLTMMHITTICHYLKILAQSR